MKVVLKIKTVLTDMPLFRISKMSKEISKFKPKEINWYCHFFYFTVRQQCFHRTSIPGTLPQYRSKTDE